MNKSVINEIREKLFILLGFTLPLSIAVTNILIVVIALICIIEGAFHEKWNKIKSSKWMISLLFLLVLYFLYYLILGTFTDTFWILKRASLLLILPILYITTFSVNTIKKSTFAFLTSMFLSSVIAIAENLHLISLNPDWTWAAFLKYTDHNVFLAFSLIISFYSIFRIKLISKYRNILLIFIPVYLFSLFTEGGKAGQLVFLFSTLYIICFLFQKKVKILLISIAGVFVFSVMVYNISDIVKNRFNKEWKNITQNRSSDRNILLKETITLIKQNPILGYGSGSFTDVFGKINEKTQKIVNSKHKTPHNNYLYVWIELGVLGFILLLSIFYFQIRELYKLKDGFVRVLFPFMYLIIMMVDSYFFSHNTLILYLFLSIVIVNYQYKLS